MFTVKVYRNNYDPFASTRSSEDENRLSIYQCRSVEVENTGITLHGFGSPEDEVWVPYPNVEKYEFDDDDWRVSQVIIENAAGKTTEVIRG